MPDLSKIKLNGVEYNIKDTIARSMGSPPLATETTDGLLSANDKQLLNSLNPNIAKTISNLNASEFGIINAKAENALSLDIAVEPTISQQIRTINLLDVSAYTPGFYIGSNGQLSSNTNDHVGDFIPVSPGDDIYYTGIIGPTNSGSINRRLHVYTANQTWIKQISFASNLKVGNSWSTHGVIPANGAYVRVSWGVEDTNVMITVGAPDKYYPYYMTPFTATTSVNFKVGHTNDPEEATSYTFNVPAAAGNLYGLKFNPILGKLWKVTEHIASYNGETLPGHWLSDRDTYFEGTTPQTGAEVIYRLADEDIVEYDCTPMVIPLNYHENYFFIENGMFLELSYYAATLAVDHLTIYSGATFGDTNILETDVIGWNRAAELIDTKADLVGAQLTGNVTAPTLSITNNSDRIATTAFVQQMLHTLAPFEPNTKASKNYEIGEYLTYAGNLYKVTAAIAKNANLTIGTNITAVEVMDEIESQSDTFIIHTETTTAGQYYNQWTGSTDKTFNEITAAYNANKILILIDDDKIYSLKRISSNLISFEAVPNIQQIDSHYKSYDGLYKDVSITYSIIKIDNSNPNIATRIKTPTTIVSHHPIIIEILDADGNTFKNGDDLTTLNANSITVGMEVGSWGNGSVSSGIFNPLTQVVVGDQTKYWMEDPYHVTSSSEWYHFAKYTVEHLQLPNSYDEFNNHIGTFKTLSERNGTPVIKTITITYREDLSQSYLFDQGDNLSQITATYSEVALSS